jgi:hypothetical protein
VTSWQRQRAAKMEIKLSSRASQRTRRRAASGSRDQVRRLPHARSIDGGQVKPLTRTGLDWSHQYKRTIEALRSLKVKSAYLDGELCAKC